MKTSINCIYKITNDHSDKCYIGLALNSLERWGLHVSRLSNNIHPNKNLTGLYKEYGLKSFNFEILKENLKEEELVKEEKIIISEIGKDKLLNISNILPEQLAIIDFKNRNFKTVGVRFLIETYGLDTIKLFQNRTETKKFSLKLDDRYSLCRLELIEKVLSNPTLEKPVFKVCKENNIILSSYNNITEAAANNKVSTMFVKNSIEGKSTFLLKEFYFTKDKEILNIPKEVHKKVRAILNKLDGTEEILEFVGVKECARHFSMVPSNVRRSDRLKTTLKKGVGRGWRFEIEN